MPKPMRSHRKTSDRDNKKDESAFSSGVKKRDGYHCRMERWDRKAKAWNVHGFGGSPNNPLFAAHIYGRDNCGEIKFKEVVGITSCLDCHDVYDHRDVSGRIDVRVPPDRERAAYKAICLAVTTFTVPRRKPPARPVKAA